MSTTFCASAASILDRLPGQRGRLIGAGPIYPVVRQMVRTFFAKTAMLPEVSRTVQ